MPTTPYVATSQEIQSFKSYYESNMLELSKLYLQLMDSRDSTHNFRYMQVEEVFYIYNKETYEQIVNDKAGYYNCVFIVDMAAVGSCRFESITFIKCKFVCLNYKYYESTFKYHSKYVFDGGTENNTNRTYATCSINAEAGYLSHFYCIDNTGTIYVHRQAAIQAVIDARFQLKKPQWESRQLKYKDRNYTFAKGGIVCGVEFEIPVRADNVQLDSRMWIKDTDCSQLYGDLEAVSRPLSLTYVSSQKFTKSVCQLWKRVKAPDNIESYISKSSESGSGIHVHISWDLDYMPVNSREIVVAMEALVESWGGEKWLLDVGGKGEYQFAEYSRYPYSHCNGKYSYCHIIDSRHIELRYGGNHPDPEVAAGRAQDMVRLFKFAVEKAMVNKAMELQKPTNHAILKMYLDKHKK